MNESEFSQIEAELGVSLPAEYQEFMRSRTAELKTMTYEESGQSHLCFDPESGVLFLDPEKVIKTNLRERGENATAYAFPRWWETFFLVGTNGGGDYFCVKLNGDADVWLIGTDCGTKPKWCADSLADFVDQWIDELQNPEPLPSSFDDSQHPETRFKFSLDEESLRVIPLEGDLPLTLPKLSEHGVEIAGVRQSIQNVVSALRDCEPEAVRLVENTIPSRTGELVFAVEAPKPADARFSKVTAEISGSYVEVSLDLKDEAMDAAPIAKNLSVDWDRFGMGLGQLLKTLISSNLDYSITAPKASRSGDAHRRWTYIQFISLD